MSSMSSKCFRSLFGRDFLNLRHAPTSCISARRNDGIVLPISLSVHPQFFQWAIWMVEEAAHRKFRACDLFPRRMTQELGTHHHSPLLLREADKGIRPANHGVVVLVGSVERHDDDQFLLL